MRRILGACIVACLTALPAHAQTRTPVDAAPAVSIGPLRFGMNLDEIRAALPQARWEESEKERFSGRATEIKATDAIEIAGRRYDVVAAYRRYDRKLDIRKTIDAPDAPACEQAGVEWLTTLEPALGPLRPAVTPDASHAGTPQWNVTRLPGGAMVITPAAGSGASAPPVVDTVAFGVGSVARFSAINERVLPIRRERMAQAAPWAMQLEAFAGPDIGAGKAMVRAAALFASEDERPCRLLVTIEQPLPLPPPAVFAFDESKVLIGPSIAYRHRATQKLRALPAGGVTLNILCELQRADGRLELCKPADPGVDIASPAAQTALRFATVTTIDTASIDRDDPQVMLLTIPIRLNPADVKQVDFLNVARVPVQSIAFARVPSSRDLTREFPEEYRRRGIGTRVTITCQIQSDGSAICGGARAEDPKLTAAFAEPAYGAMQGLVARDTLRDGRPSVGAVFDIPVNFRLQD